MVKRNQENSPTGQSELSRLLENMQRIHTSVNPDNLSPGNIDGVVRKLQSDFLILVSDVPIKVLHQLNDLYLRTGYGTPEFDPTYAVNSNLSGILNPGDLHSQILSYCNSKDTLGKGHLGKTDKRFLKKVAALPGTGKLAKLKKIFSEYSNPGVMYRGFRHRMREADYCPFEIKIDADGPHRARKYEVMLKPEYAKLIAAKSNAPL